MFRAMFLAFSAVLIAGSAAQALTLACVNDRPSSKDFVPKGVIVEINPNNMLAAVLDDFTLEAMDGPAMAELSRPGKNRIKLDWELNGVKDKLDRKLNVKFKMSINTASMKFNYTGVAGTSYQVPGTASGRCAPVKPKS